MDFTIYINFQDVREHHRKIDYKNKKHYMDIVVSFYR